MANKMLIDATHPEETRVVVLKGDRVEEFDLESQDKRQLRGNIYLAKVTRVEPSLQAAFVDYGGNRHGFLAFSEIHPDYYQIPVADRKALLEEARQDAVAEDDDDPDTAPAPKTKRRTRSRKPKVDRNARKSEVAIAEAPADPEPSASEAADATEVVASSVKDTVIADDSSSEVNDPAGAPQSTGSEAGAAETDAPVAGSEDAGSIDSVSAAEDPPAEAGGEPGDEKPKRKPRRRRAKTAAAAAVTPTVSEEYEDGETIANGDVESIGAEDALEELPSRRTSRRKIYKIQEVIRRRQILLVQVVKEERGTKGAALTTYLSLAGRYCVLMPNTARGGGISRKITNPTDRRRLKTIASDLEVPEGTGVIVRTAGAQRTKAEIKRDFEYLLRMWETIRDLTLKSTAPSLIYEEGSLVKRSIRDLYSKDIDEVQVEGEEAYREGKAFMRMLMPSHAKNVKQYKDPQPLFTRHRVESQLDQMFSPVVTLKSGGYLVINQTEALVAVDVNSGRSTREHNIEDTALKTNMEAAGEVARQLRLRDLAGLIVIDFIDMEEKRNNRSVEKKLKDCLKSDRARIQVGRISHFGLLEMSRQRIRASVLEGTMEQCTHCQGTGRVRSVGSTALQIVRALEEQAIANPGRNLTIRTNTEIALYMLNQKRSHLSDIEGRFAIRVDVAADATNLGSSFTIEKGAVSETSDTATTGVVQIDSVFDGTEEPVTTTESDSETTDEEDTGRKRRRRRRRRRPDETSDAPVEAGEPAVTEEAPSADEDTRPKRRRGRRGGRRRRGEGTAPGEPAAPVSWAWSTDDEPQPAPEDEPSVADDDTVVEAAAEETPRDEDHPADSDVVAEDPEPMGDPHPALTGEPGGMADTPVLEEAATVRVAEISESPVDDANIASSGESPEPAPDEPSKKGWWQRRFVPSRQA